VTVFVSRESYVLIYDVFSALENIGGSLIRAKVDCKAGFVGDSDRGGNFSFNFQKLEDIYLAGYGGTMRFSYKFENLKTFTIDYLSVAGQTARDNLKQVEKENSTKFWDEMPNLEHFIVHRNHYDMVKKEKYPRVKPKECIEISQ